MCDQIDEAVRELLDSQDDGPFPAPHGTEGIDMTILGVMGHIPLCPHNSWRKHDYYNDRTSQWVMCPGPLEEAA